MSTTRLSYTSFTPQPPSKAANWDLEWLSSPPYGDMVVPYVADARVPSTQGGSVPGARSAFKDIIAEVASGVPAKVGGRYGVG